MTRASFAAGLLLLAAALQGCDSSREPRQNEESAATAGTIPDEVMAEIQNLGYDLGPADAPVTVVEFSDFGCPYCARFGLETFPIINQEYVQSGRVRWKYVPFALGTFPNGVEAALAGECGGAQDRFWAMHDQLYLAQEEWKATDQPAAVFAEIARRAGLEAQSFAQCYSQNERGAAVQQNNAAARLAGVTGTPTFLLNGMPIQGAPPIDQFRQVLDLAVSGKL